MHPARKANFYDFNGKNYDLAKIYKNLIRYRSKNNFTGLLNYRERSSWLLEHQHFL